MKERITPAMAFLFLAIPVTLVLVFLTPPFWSVPDEQSHFYRAFHLSEFNLQVPAVERNGERKVGAELPKSLVAVVKTMRVDKELNPEDCYRTWYSRTNQPLQPDDRVWVEMENTAPYPFMTYVPQALGIGFARLFGASPLILLLAGRLTNLALWIAVTYLALRMIPFGGWLMMTIAFLPSSLFPAASLSTDSANNCFSFLLVATAVRAATIPEKNRAIFITFVLSSFMLLSLKAFVTTWPLCLLFFAFPQSAFGSKRRHVQVCLAYIVSCIAVLGFGLLLTRSGHTWHAYWEVESNPTEQAMMVMREPWRFLTAFWNAISAKGMWSIFNMNIYRPSIPAVAWRAYLFLSFIVCIALFDQPCNTRLPYKARVPLLLAPVAHAFLAALVLYILFSPVGSETMRFSGRYLVCDLLPLGLGVFGATLNLRKNRSITKALALCFSVIMIAHTIGMVFGSCYLKGRNLLTEENSILSITSDSLSVVRKEDDSGSHVEACWHDPQTRIWNYTRHLGSKFIKLNPLTTYKLHVEVNCDDPPMALTVVRLLNEKYETVLGVELKGKKGEWVGNTFFFTTFFEKGEYRIMIFPRGGANVQYPQSVKLRDLRLTACGH